MVGFLYLASLSLQLLSYLIFVVINLIWYRATPLGVLQQMPLYLFASSKSIHYACSNTICCGQLYGGGISL